MYLVGNAVPTYLPISENKSLLTRNENYISKNKQDVTSGHVASTM
jgi:hypothetical protein